MLKRTIRSLVAVSVLAVALPASAGAAVYVAGGVPVTPGGRSCTQPTYSTIQAALNASASTIDVCPGTYTEQLTITRPVNLKATGTSGSADVVLPAAPVDTVTPCDQAPGTGSYQPDQDGVSICTAGTVAITGLKFEPKWPGSKCYDSLYGILVAGGATLKAKDVTVDGGGAFPINGCQGGIGIQVGMAWTSPVEVGHATLQGVTVTDYQKNGITVDGAGSSVANTELSGNDIGAYYYSSATKQPSAPELTLSKDVFATNRYEGIVLDQGDALVKGATITGPGNVGIDLLQYNGQTLSSQSSATGVHVEGQSVGVKVESDHAAEGDLPGRFVLSTSALSGNVTPLVNESSDFEVVI